MYFLLCCRSLLSRDQKGHLVAGVYFKVKPKNDEFTIFYQDMGKQRTKMSFSSLTESDVSLSIKIILNSLL